MNAAIGASALDHSSNGPEELLVSKRMRTENTPGIQSRGRHEQRDDFYFGHRVISVA